MAWSRELEPSIPTVDIGPFLANASPNAVADVVEAMRHACSTYGFFYLVGHGVSEEDRQSALACARLFFALPKAEKMEVAISRCMGKSLRGYEPPGIQTHQEGLLPDIKEVYNSGPYTLNVYLIDCCRHISSAQKSRQTIQKLVHFLLAPTCGRRLCQTTIFASQSWHTKAK